VAELKKKHDGEYYNTNDKTLLARHISGEFKRIWFSSDEFMTKLLVNRNNPQDAFSLVKHDFKRFRDTGFTLFDLYDKMILPVNLDSNHWCLAEVIFDNPERFDIKIFDSLPIMGNYEKIADCLKNFIYLIINEYCGRDNGEYLQKLKNLRWTYQHKMKRQQNGYDCGVFICGYMRDLTNQKDVTFNQSDCKNLRNDILQYLLS